MKMIISSIRKSLFWFLTC